MKAIQKELGEMDDVPNELGDLEKKIEKAGMPKEANEKAVSELNKLKLMSPMSAEATVVRNYVDWLVKAPWKKRSKVFKSLKKAEDVLEEDHYGLEKVKERILEYLAVQKRVKRLKAITQGKRLGDVYRNLLGIAFRNEFSQRCPLVRLSFRIP